MHGEFFAGYPYAPLTQDALAGIINEVRGFDGGGETEFIFRLLRAVLADEGEEFAFSLRCAGSAAEIMSDQHKRKRFLAERPDPVRVRFVDVAALEQLFAPGDEAPEAQFAL